MFSVNSVYSTVYKKNLVCASHFAFWMVQQLNARQLT